MKAISSTFVAAILAAGCGFGASGASPSTPHPLTIDQLLEIKHPSNAIWSPDGRYVAFVWDEGGVGNLYVVETAAGPASCKKLTSFHEGQVASPFWSKTGATIYFPHAGSLWQVDVTSGAPRAAWNATGRMTSFALSPDGADLAFVRSNEGSGSDLVVRSLSSGSERTIAHDETSIAAPVWSPDGKHISFSAGSKTILHEQTPAYSGAKIIYTITERTPGRLLVASSSGGDAIEIHAPVGMGGARWLDAQHLVFDRQSADFKKRTSYVADIHTGNVTAAHEDVEDKFWSIPYDSGASAQPSPDGNWI
ncbi:MAG: PD40 domain-containing protein, partial [Acidobacteriaceae bacterium]|nr:PD40 domain-containing protein [Acidobacteriaceae bacterium]